MSCSGTFRRLLNLIPILFIMTSFVFIICPFLPGGPIEMLVPPDEVCDENVCKAMEKELGLDRAMRPAYVPGGSRARWPRSQARPADDPAYRPPGGASSRGGCGPIIARLRAASRRRWDGPTVKHGRRGLGSATARHAQYCTQAVPHVLEDTDLAPAPALLRHRLPGRQIVWH